LGLEPVLVGWTSAVAEVGDVDSSGSNYTMRRARLSKEPLYQPATRQKLKLTIADALSHAVETGFSEIILTPGTKPVVWPQLPSGMADAFKRAMLESARERAQPPPGGAPPPR
jgi:hypothetical protein